MSKNEKEVYLKNFKAFSKELASSSEKSRRFLIESGIYTRNGKLSKNYQSNDNKCINQKHH